MKTAEINMILKWVVEYDICEKYKEIVDEALKFYKEDFNNACIDCDDISSAREWAVRKFKVITGHTIYEALSQAYGYAPKTIEKKLQYGLKRKRSWLRYCYPSYDGEIKTLDQDDILTMCWVLQVVGAEVKNSKVEPHIKRAIEEGYGVKIEDADIQSVLKAKYKRIDKIYNSEKRMSKVAPILCNWENTTFMYESKNKAEKSDENIIKKALRDTVKNLAGMGCTTVCYEIDLEDGTKWAIDFRKLWIRPNE